jgi:hypothetical protein
MSTGDPKLSSGFTFLHAAETRPWLERHGSLADWDAFTASWEGMPVDTYMRDGGRYRRRRHAVFTASPEGAIMRAAHQPHYQTLDYNPLHGGIERWFEPVLPEVANGATFQTVLAACGSLFMPHRPNSAWRIEAHQFRIEARSGEVGQPTPEGMHRDGVDYVLVLLVSRRNILSGTTTIHGLDRALLGSFTLTEPLDAALVDDRRVYHGVTPVEPDDPAYPAWRDVLVVTWLATN